MLEQNIRRLEQAANYSELRKCTKGRSMTASRCYPQYFQIAFQPYVGQANKLPGKRRCEPLARCLGRLHWLFLELLNVSSRVIGRATGG